MEADDFDPILSQFGPMLTNPELQPGIDPGFVGDDVPEAESIAEFIMRLHGNLDQSSQRQQSRRQDTQLIRNQGTDFQLLRPISISLPNTQLQRHPRQPNSPVQNNILDNPNISTTSLNETVAHVVNKGNSTTGISTNSLVEQWSSISRLLPNTVVQGLQKSHQNLTRYEQALEQSRPQVMLVVSSRNVQQLQIIRETLAETRNKCQMERERWFQVLEIARTQQRDRLVDTFIGDIEELVNRATELCSEYKTFGHSVESLLHQLQLQQQQSPQNPMLNPGLGGDDGAGPQVPWNFPGAQNPSLNTRIPVQNQQMMNASQNRVGGNPPNHNLGGANLSTTSPQNLQVSPNHLDNRPPGPNMPPNTAKNRADLVKANFSKFLLTVNIDPVIHLAGRTIEMWDLYHAAREFDARFGRDNPAKFRMISYQLGLPSYGPEQL
ncbi:hypothetical protein CPB86DRAFT_462728 [Serendipita vermifera]|nr:hypothetical protein CPB86DRAFT_462728 [Serendipita vermifera]